jgi:hypothetical protein
MSEAGLAVARGAANTLTVAKFAKQDPGRVDRAYNDSNTSVQNVLASVEAATPGKRKREREETKKGKEKKKKET